MKKFFKIVLLVVVIAAFLGTFVFLYRKSRPEEVTYQTLTAETRMLERTTVVTGTIEPRDEVLIKPQISGIISELYKEAGEQVKQGEVIAKVKVIPDMTALSSAENRVRLARINETQSRTDYERMKALYDDGLVSAEEFEQTRLAYDQAKEHHADTLHHRRAHPGRARESGKFCHYEQHVQRRNDDCLRGRHDRPRV